MPCLTRTIALFVLLAVAAFVWASESDELREKAEAIGREAAELAERGHKAEAAELKRKSAALLKEAEQIDRERPDSREAKIHELHRVLEKLRGLERELSEQAGAGEKLAAVRREAEGVEKKLRHLARGQHEESQPAHEHIARRLEHMRAAVEHLHQAELHDIAEHVAQRAEATERELREHRRHHEGDVLHELMKQLDELRHEVGRLRAEVSEIRRKP
jgi:hypothetical protein